MGVPDTLQKTKTKNFSRSARLDPGCYGAVQLLGLFHAFAPLEAMKSRQKLVLL